MCYREGFLPLLFGCMILSSLHQEKTDISLRPPSVEYIIYLLEAPHLWAQIANSFEKAGYKIPDAVKQDIETMKQAGEFLYKMGDLNPLIMKPEEAKMHYGKI